jgi:pteridine reductase
MNKIVLITGGARRIGKAIVEHLHDLNYCVAIHCNISREEANKLAEELNAKRPDSAFVVQGDLRKTVDLNQLIHEVIAQWGRLDALVNNASAFYTTNLSTVSESVWNDLLDCNAKAPFFLSQAAYPYLKKTKGSIVNITDIHADGHPLKDYGIYSMSKSLLWHQTQCLAKEWSPEVRVNAVAPGMVLWPEGENILNDNEKQKILNQTPLKKEVDPLSIAKAVSFLITSEDITGEVIRVSAGRGII